MIQIKFFQGTYLVRKLGGTHTIECNGKSTIQQFGYVPRLEAFHFFSKLLADRRGVFIFPMSWYIIATFIKVAATSG